MNILFTGLNVRKETTFTSLWCNNLTKRIKMRAVFIVMVLLIAGLNLQAETTHPMMQNSSDWSKLDIRIIAGKNNNLYMFIDSVIYHREGIESEWEKIYNLPRKYSVSHPYMNPKNVRFFKDNSNQVYFATENILYLIDSKKHVVKPIYSVETQILSVIFEEDKFVIIEDDKLHYVDYNYNIQQHHDLSSLFYDSSIDMHEFLNRLCYTKEFGVYVNLRVASGMYEEAISFSTNDNMDIIPVAKKILDTDSDVFMVSNISNNILYVSTGYHWHSADNYFYDLINKTKIELPFEECDINENSNYITALDINSNSVKYSTNRGEEWQAISKYSFELASVSSDGCLYGFNHKDGLLAFDISSQKWYSLDMPSYPTNRINGEIKDYFEINNDLWALWSKNGIIRSNDNGKTWNRIPLPVEDVFEDAFYIDETENIYYICDKGLYKKTKNEDWNKVFNDMPDHLIDGFKIIDADESKVLIAFDQVSEYELHSFSLVDRTLTNLNNPFIFMEKSNQKYLFVSSNNQSTVLEYDKDFNELNSTSLSDETSAIQKAVFDSQENLYLATTKGVYKKEAGEITLDLIGDIQKPIENMFLNENDTLFVDYRANDNHMYFIQPNSIKVDTLHNSMGWYNKRFVYLSDNNVSFFCVDPYNTSAYSYLLPKPQLKLKVDYTNPSYVDNPQTITISPVNSDYEDFEVKIRHFNNLSDTVIKAPSGNAVYKLDITPNQVQNLQVIGSKLGYLDFSSEIIVLKSDVSNKEAKISPLMNDRELRLDTEQNATFSFEIITTSHKDTKEGMINIENTFNQESKSFKHDGISPSEYEFYIPKDAQNGLYKIKYSGESDEYGEIPEKYFYFIVHDRIFDSVEEQNSIITNTKVLPNPATTTADIQFEMKEAGDLTCEIYDMSGRLLLSIPTNGYYAAGKANLSIDVTNLANGQYMIFLKAQDKATAAKLLILK